MKIKIFTILLLVSFIFSFSLHSQNSDTGKEKTVEDIFLQSVEVTVIMELASSESRDAKIKALDAIEDMIENGRKLESDQNLMAAIEYLSMEGNGIRIRERGRLINNYPEIRRRACEAFGKIGGEIAKASLINVLLTENEPMVLAEAAYALGTIGNNDNNQVSQALAYSILSQSIMTPDNNFAFAVLLTIEKLAEANNGIDDPGTIRALVRIQNGNYIKTVKRKADAVIDKLRFY